MRLRKGKGREVVKDSWAVVKSIARLGDIEEGEIIERTADSDVMD